MEFKSQTMKDLEQKTDDARQKLRDEVEGSPEWCAARGYLDAIQDLSLPLPQVSNYEYEVGLVVKLNASSTEAFTPAEAYKKAKAFVQTALAPADKVSGPGPTLNLVSVKPVGQVKIDEPDWDHAGW